MSIINFNFVMIHIIHKILVLIKNQMNYLQDSISKCCLKSIINFFHNLENPRPDQQNIQDIKGTFLD